ncbi:MAG: DUF1934 domain-containing protein [Moorellaceae bacterium]
MKKEVLVKVKGTQTHEWGEQDSIEFVTEGRLFSRDNSYYILYNESGLAGMEGTTTSLKIEPSRVTLNRMGTAEHKATFEEGVLSDGFYVTPYGTMRLTILPFKVEVHLTESGGSINLEYELQVGYEKVSYNQLEITVSSI